VPASGKRFVGFLIATLIPKNEMPYPESFLFPLSFEVLIRVTEDCCHLRCGAM
jgi:hypothetical protein